MKDVSIKGTRDHAYRILKLEKTGCVRDSRKYFFLHREVGSWNDFVSVQ